MYRNLCLTTFCGFMLAVSSASVAGPPVHELSRLETEWNRAHVAGDADALLAMTRPDATIIVPGMPLFTPREAFGVLRSAHMRFESYESRDVRYTFARGTGVVTGRLQRVRVMGDRKVTDDWLFTKVWVHDRSGWRLFAFHSSPAP